MGSQVVSGKGSVVTIENTAEHLRERISIHCGENCSIHIEGLIACNTRLSIYAKDNAEIIIGPDQLMNGDVEINMQESSKISVGQGCLWAGCKLWSSDMHPIYDLSTGLRINPAQDINIGSHVWFGADCLILKGAQIPDGCVIGAMAVISAKTRAAPNSIIVGNPARQVREGIRWDLSF